jgi:predicted DCC family thiol-disulfide oxidoreductase YuxK
MMVAPAFPLTVYYDASCPLCRSEMETLKARDAGNVLRLVDCSASAFNEAPCAAEGVTRPMMMARIHARDAGGRWLRGVDVFAVVYRAAGFTALARIYESRLLRPLFDRLYPWIADHRYLLTRCGLPRLFRWLAPVQRDCATCAGNGISRRSAIDDPRK